MASSSMEDEAEEGSAIEEDYYAFLNVPRSATNDEISNAYRRLSRLYHPDKHLDPDHKKEAEILFNKTKKAYEVLSDAHQRAIYDNLGTRGLETEGWEIVQRTKTPQEIREEYERLARERDERRLQQRTNPKGNVVVSINATDIFNRYEEDYELEEFGERSFIPNIEVSGMSFAQSIEAPLTLRDTVTMSGQLSTHNGNGSGSVNFALKRLLSERGWIEAEMGVGNGLMISMKGFRTLTKRMFTNLAGIFQFTPQGIRPGIVASVATQLDKQTVGYLTWKAGIQSSMSTIVVRDTSASHTAFTIQFGVPHSYISLGYTRKLEEQELKLRASIKAGTFGALFEYGAEKKISQHSNLGASVAIGTHAGVSLKIRLIRANQTYTFPIHLCEEVLPSPIFYATVAPVVIWLTVKKLLVDPYVKEQKEKEKAKQRELNKTRMKEKRREAKAAVDLMGATFSRIRSEEESRKGLVIVKALYGQLVSGIDAAGSEEERGDEVIDVTIPLQCLVKDSKLILHEATKSQLPGFYDPCVGEDKSLMVQYLFHGVLHQVTVKDNDFLRIPKQSHRINPT